MKKSIVISDSFKGTLSSSEICTIAKKCFLRVFPACEVIAVPVADGGEGTADCFREACSGTWTTIPVLGPYHETVHAAYVRLPDGKAVVEMASCAGLPLVGENRNPCETSTYGVGQQIRHAVANGCKSVIVGLGGSATNDGGCGCAAALGVRFLDKHGKEFVPTGGTLDEIASIESGESRRLLDGVSLTAMCDIDNPMHGETGAAYVFATQKGADREMVERLDNGLKHLDRVIQKSLGKCVADIPGAGAAGGFGAGMLAFFDAQLQSGIETVLDLVKFDEQLKGCDMVFTGEGSLDSQSIRGKTISGVAKRAREHHVPVIAVVGAAEDGIEKRLYSLGVSAVFTINRRAEDFSISRYHSEENYAAAFENILRLIRVSQKMK